MRAEIQLRAILKFTYVSDTHVCTYVYTVVPSPTCVLYIGGVGKVLGVSIGLQNKRLALKPHNPPSSCSGQSSLALEYSFTHLALACLSIRYVMYPRSTLTPCPARLLLALPSPHSPSFLPSLLLRASRHVTDPTQVRKIKERHLRSNLHPYRAHVYTNTKTAYSIEPRALLGFFVQLSLPRLRAKLLLPKVYTHRVQFLKETTRHIQILKVSRKQLHAGDKSLCVYHAIEIIRMSTD